MPFSLAFFLLEKLLCIEYTYPLTNSYVEVLTNSTSNMNHLKIGLLQLFKLRSYWKKVESHMTGVLIKSVHWDAHMHTGKTLCELDSRDQGNASMSKERQILPANH